MYTKSDIIKNSTSIAILLATYNGALYLEQQIESILYQSFDDWTLFINDDGSSDNTVSIIKSYANKFKEKIIFLQIKQKKLGASMNFQNLLYAVDSKYYMFCDQDDFWLPNKLEISMHAMNLSENRDPRKPILVHTDLTIVGKELQIINKSFYRYSKTNPLKFCTFNFLGVANCVTGCTILVNNPVKRLINQLPKTGFMYDWWIAIQVSKNGIINYIPESTVLYRQHTRNLIGAKHVGIRYFINILINIRKNIKIDIHNYKILKKINYGSATKYITYKALFQIIRLLY